MVYRVISYQLSVISYQLPVISYKLKAKNKKIQDIRLGQRETRHGRHDDQTD